MGINPKYFAYYPENKKDKIIRLLKARLSKFFKEFKSKYVENCEIEGLEKIGYLVDLVGLTYPFKKLIQDTLVEEYHKLTEWRAIKNTNEIDKERIQYIISLIPKVIKRRKIEVLDTSNWCEENQKKYKRAVKAFKHLKLDDVDLNSIKAGCLKHNQKIFSNFNQKYPDIISSTCELIYFAKHKDEVYLFDKLFCPICGNRTNLRDQLWIY